MQLEAAKRILTAARKVVLDHSATLCFSGLQLEAAKRIEVAGRQLSQRRSSPDKRLLREEAAERRGTSAKMSLSEEVAQQKSIAHLLSIHSFIHPVIRFGLFILT